MQRLVCYGEARRDYNAYSDEATLKASKERTHR